MSRRVGRALAVVLAGGLALSAGGAALAAPVGALKQFKVPTARSQPRAITTGSDGNVWFTEGTEFTGAPAKIARVTPAGAITEFAPGLADGCNGCIITDIARGPGDHILYITSNDPTLMRFDITTQSFLAPVQMPNSGALGGDLAVSSTDVWITDFNTSINDATRGVIWRYNSTTGVFDGFAASDPADVAVDAAGNAWFTEPQANLDGSSNIGRIGANALPSDANAVARTVTTAAARDLTVSPVDGKVWFAARFGIQAVGFLDPADNNNVTLFPVADTGPNGIASSSGGTVWFTQETAGNIASINNAGVITEAKTVKGSGPFGITVDGNGNPWYTMMAANKVANFQLR